MNATVRSFRWLAVITASLTLLAVLQLREVFSEAGVLIYPFWHSRLLFLQVGLSFLVVLSLAVAFSLACTWTFGILNRIGKWLGRHRVWVFLAGVFPLGLLLAFSLGPYHQYQAGRWVQFWLIWLTGLAVGLLLKSGWPGRSLFFWLAGGLLLTGFSLTVGVQFSQVTDYPFAVHWSEGQLLTNAAQVAGTKVWGQTVDWPIIKRSHALLQSLSFWLPGDQPLWLHRLWNSFLWILFPLGLAVALAGRLKTGSRIETGLLALFGFLFLSQGPVYFDLTPVPLLVLLGFRLERPGRILTWVLLASVWAGFTRLNWFPVAGVTAALLYFLEQPYRGKFRGYFLRPLTWVGLGTVTAYTVNRLYLFLAGTPVDNIGRFFSSRMLWYRLLPSSTFDLGVLPAVVFVTSGLLGLVAWKIVLEKGLHPWRRAAILAVLTVFFLGGLVISAKIGGGDNIHNFDAFLVLLLVASLYAFYQRVKMDSETSSPIQIPAWSIVLMVCLPLFYLAPQVPYLPPLDPATITRIEQQLEEKVGQVQATGKPILFISNQQMLAVKRFEGLLPEPNYEVVFLMEMAITENEEYFQEFYQRLERQEWGLIIIDNLSLETFGRERAFGEETTAWVEWVVKPIREDYLPVGGSRLAGLILLEPR